MTLEVAQYIHWLFAAFIEPESALYGVVDGTFR